MSSLFALRALLFAGEMLVGSILIFTLAWIFATQKTAGARHLTWAGAFAAALAVPILAVFVPPAFRILLPAQAQSMPALPDPHFVAMLPQTAPGAFSVDASTIALALAALWLFGVCIALGRLTIGAACLATLKRRSRPFALAPADEPKIAATHRECELRLCESETGPVTWGVFWPVILLPMSAIFWTRERLHAVLLHELAHIRRRDALVQALSQFVCALYWPNPLVWIAANRMRREAEIAADDAVIVTGVKPSRYAGELLELAQEFRARQLPLAAVGFFMAAPSSLKARVECVLSPTQSRTGVTPRDVQRIAAIAVVAAASIAFACPSLAQESIAPAVAAAHDVPPTPSVPSIPSEPAAHAIPAPASAEFAPAVRPAPPAPPADETDRAVRMETRAFERHQRHELRRLHVAILSAARDAHRSIARVQPAVDRAIDEAKINEAALRAMQPQIDAAMRTVATAHPEIDRAIAQVQPAIDTALAKLHADLVKEHVDLRLRAHVDEALQRAEIRIEAAHEHGRDTDDDESGDTQTKVKSDDN